MAEDFNMDKFLAETDKKAMKYKKLIKSNEFDSIPDGDLYYAVIDLLCDKNSAEMQLLPLTCQYVNAVNTVTNMAYSEDFETVYTEYNQLTNLAADGLFEIGEPELGEVIKQSNVIYENSKDIISKHNQEIISWGELLDMELWEKAHEKFYNVYDNGKKLLKSIENYIRKNSKDFYAL